MLGNMVGYCSFKDYHWGLWANQEGLIGIMRRKSSSTTSVDSHHLVEGWATIVTEKQDPGKHQHLKQFSFIFLIVELTLAV